MLVRVPHVSLVVQLSPHLQHHPQPLLSDMTDTLTLWCLLEGEIEPFRIKTSGQEDIYELKNAIYNEREIRRSTELFLYKV